MKTSQLQFEMMITFMEQHGDLSKPSANPRGRIAALKHWEELTSLLNSDGNSDKKNTEKWKKVWSDYKNNTKKKAARLHRAASTTGGGPAVFSKLTDLEQRVLNLIGKQAATGLAIDEAGFSQDVSILQGISAGPSNAQSPIPETENIQLELSIEQGNEEEPPLAQLVPPHIQMGDEITEGVEAFNQPSPGSNVQIVAEPQVQPAQSGQTARTYRNERESSRILRRTPRRLFRRSPQRPVRQTNTIEAAQQFVHSDTQWREFRMQQHRDYIEMRREQNRIRELEVQTQREWQAVGLRVLELFDRLVTRFCRD